MGSSFFYPPLLHALGKTLGWLAAVMLTASAAQFDSRIPRHAIEPITNAPTSSPMLMYKFEQNGTLEEAPSMEQSSSPYFWLNSGGRLTIENGFGRTIQGALNRNDEWRALYYASNPIDTDNGARPQNLFRLITRSSWSSPEQTLRFNITKTNPTNTPNRGAWSGVFLMSHYQDNDHLYYAGIRFDGSAVIKKKCRGAYHTLASAPLFTSRQSSQNAIPTDTWHEMRSVVYTDENDAVIVELWMRAPETKQWRLIVSAADNYQLNRTPILTGSSHVGIRTDYSDVTFDRYEVIEHRTIQAE